MGLGWQRHCDRRPSDFEYCKLGPAKELGNCRALEVWFELLLSVDGHK